MDERQFIICKDKIEKENFCSLALDHGYVLYYHKSLKVRRMKDFTVIGLAFSIHPDYPVGRETPYPLEEQIRMWGGRFIVYQRGRIYTDATKSLGIFYLVNGRHQKESRVISSSVHLLTELYHLERRNEFELSFEPREIASDFYPGPCTPFVEIRRLMQYEKIDFLSEDFVSEEGIEWNPVYRSWTAEKLSEQLIQYETYMMREVNKEYKNVYVPLTGGWDSRCVAAICKKAQIPFSTYTELRTKETHKAGFSKGDRELPKLLADIWNVKWELCKPDVIDDNKFKEIIKHSMGMVRNTNLYSYAYDQYPVDKNNGIILHGAVWGVSREFYGNSISGECNSIRGQERNLRSWMGELLSESDVHRESIQTWMQDIHTYGLGGMKWTERFHLDQRLGCWMSDLNQALDLVKLDRVSPANNYEVLSILMAYSEKLRKKGEHQKMIIHICTPEVDNIPVNPKPIGKRIEKIIRQFMRNCIKVVAELSRNKLKNQRRGRNDGYDN